MAWLNMSGMEDLDGSVFEGGRGKRQDVSQDQILRRSENVLAISTPY